MKIKRDLNKQYVEGRTFRFNRWILRRKCFGIKFMINIFVLLFFSVHMINVVHAQQNKKIPLVWCTDLFHPHQDPDDHVDLATVFSMTEFDIKAILLDQGDKQEEHPGSVVLDQMMALTGKDIPYAIGLSDKLRSDDDTGEDQAKCYQGAVKLFLKTLEQAKDPVQVIVAGSLRDIVAAFNREPQLVRSKVARLHINIGRAALGKGEWNVHLDPLAYRRLLNSGLPISLYPCLPLNSLNSSHWLLKHYGDVFDSAPLPLQNFFIYALNRVDTNEIDPISALNMDLRPWRRLIWGKEKNMWCTASIINTAGRKIYLKENEWIVPDTILENAIEEVLFSMVPARVEVDEKGYTTVLDYNSSNPNVESIQLTNQLRYTEAMTGCLRYLFEYFPVKLAAKSENHK